MPCRLSHCAHYSDGEGKCLADDEDLPSECREMLDIPFTRPVTEIPSGDCSSCCWSCAEGCFFDGPCPGDEVGD
jgi:hypothetical protein